MEEAIHWNSVIQLLVALAVEVTEADIGCEDIVLVMDLWRFPSTDRARIVMMVYLEVTISAIIIFKKTFLDMNIIKKYKLNKYDNI